MSFRQIVFLIFGVVLSLTVLSCSGENADKRDASGTNDASLEEGLSEANVPLQTLLDTGLVYELPVAVTLYPTIGMDTASQDSLNPLIKVPIGSKFGVFTRKLVGKTPWYAVRIFAGPQSGWKDVAGHPLDSLKILSYMATNQGIPGWINHRDIEGRPMRYTPYPRVDSTKGKKQRK